MRLLIVILVSLGVGLTAWLLLRGDDRPGGDRSAIPPESWWIDALGGLTSPLAPVADMPTQAFDLSAGEARLRVPPGRGPRVVRFALEAGPGPVPILFDGTVLYLLARGGPALAQPCAPPKCASGRGRVSLAIPDGGGEVTLGKTPGSTVRLLP